MRRRRHRDYPPRPSVPAPRSALLAAVREFVGAARKLEGVRRIALVGSLTTEKPVPKDADLLVTIAPAMDLAPLAACSRRLKGVAQSCNLGADIFLCDESPTYLGRICGYRQCFARVLCRARNCGARQHLNDDLGVVTLACSLLQYPPIVLWPSVIRTLPPPPDVEELLIARLTD